jgi:hypothetical protein
MPVMAMLIVGSFLLGAVTLQEFAMMRHCPAGPGPKPMPNLPFGAAGSTARSAVLGCRFVRDHRLILWIEANLVNGFGFLSLARIWD